jgi:hypothetical protein
MKNHGLTIVVMLEKGELGMDDDNDDDKNSNNFCNNAVCQNIRNYSGERHSLIISDLIS